MENELRRRIRAYHERELRMKHQVASQANEIKSLRAVIGHLLDGSGPRRRKGEETQDDDDDLSEMDTCENDERDDDGGAGGEDADDSDEVSVEKSLHELPEAVSDSADEIFRCSECCWEVFENICEGCQTEHRVDQDHIQVQIESSSSISTDHKRVNPDRRLKPRGSTPLREVGHIRDLPGYTRDEYHALIARGATRQMCEAFSLEFTWERGIVAWADDELFKTFSGKAMKDGDKWKIYLGRRIDLDEDDIDGAQFVEDLLEEILLFPSHPRGPLGLERVGKGLRWETVRESLGTWATRPMVDRDLGTEDQDEEAARGEEAEDEGEQYDIHEDLEDYESDDMNELEEHQVYTGQEEITDKTLAEEEDDALEQMLPRENLGPVIGFEDYETDAEERVDELIGWTGIYDSELQNSDESEHDYGSEKVGAIIDLSCHVKSEPCDVQMESEHAQYDQSDSVDSDFDSQEQLSGDEDILRMA